MDYFPSPIRYPRSTMKYAANLSMAITALAVATLGYCATNPHSSQLTFSMRVGLALVAALGLVCWMLASLRHRRLELKYLAEFGQYLRGLRNVSNQDSCPAPPTSLSAGVRESCESLRACVLEHIQRLDQATRLRAAAESRVGRQTERVNQLRQVLHHLPSPVLAIDQYDELLEANAAARQLLGLATEFEGSRVDDLASPELAQLLRDAHKGRGRQRVAELNLGCPDDERRFRVTCTPLAPEDGEPNAEPIGVLAVLTDVSNETAIQKRNAEFVSAVSHEMKTPLASIKAYTEMLADGEVQDEEVCAEFFDVIGNQADRLHRLVDNMLNLARIEAGVVEVSKNALPLNTLLGEACDVVAPRAEEKQIELVRNFSPMYLGVLVDRDMMLQAVINLLSNAIKYTPEGGMVTLRSRMEDNLLAVEVADNGVGLSEEDCQRVFDKFYRVKKQEKMAAGTGLGLPLTKHIIEDVHSGRLTLSSKLGAGSVFRIELPPHAAPVAATT